MHLIDTVLLVTLPGLILGKTLTFAWFVHTMHGAVHQGQLGVWLYRFFLWLAVVSGIFTVLFVVFAVHWHHADLTRWVLLMAPLEGAIALVCWCGWRVMRAYRVEVEGRP